MSEICDGEKISDSGTGWKKGLTPSSQKQLINIVMEYEGNDYNADEVKF